MKFDELDTKMRVFETAHDHCVLPEIIIVARADGRGFTKLTKEVHKFKAPFDSRFRDYMIETTKHLMNIGLHVVYGYTQSDEISILLHKNDKNFNRKLRKLNSVLAGEASAKFSLLLGELAAFDCRISQLPSVARVVDYFRWRNEDAHRNALNAHCYWLLRHSGENPRSATRKLSGMSVAAKNELLFSEGGINFNELPLWQRRGTGIYWEEYEKEGYNPLTSKTSIAKRKRLKVDMNLPMKDAYSQFIEKIVIDKPFTPISEANLI